MNPKFQKLFSPLQVGTFTFKNRIVGAPIYCGNFATLPFLSDVLFQNMSTKAKGGCAQITVGETPVDFDYANREPFPPIDYTNYEDPVFHALKKVVDVIKAHGAVAMIELSHCGESKLKIPGLKNPIGPMGYVREDGAEVVALDEALMQSVCDNFVTCATFMRAIGFDGVMIHAGHGWLLHQFLSARTNQRADAYGGSLANRARFPRRVIESVRQAMGKDFLLEVRVSGDERTPGGMGVEETAEFCKSIEDLVDLIHVSVGLYRDPILSGQFSSVFAPHGLNGGYAGTIKKAVSIPVTVVGGINAPEQAEQLLAEGKCDLVALARQLTADPEFVNKVETGRDDDILPCLRCYKCFPGPLEDNIEDLSSLFGCAVNPEAFYFDRAVLDSRPAGSRKVLVIGGGIGGMEAAVIAADRGHQVTLIERTNQLGGLLKFADTDAYKGDLGRFKDVMARRVQTRKIDVRLNTDFSPADVAAFGAEAVIVAVGSRPIEPPIQGVENALRALDVYENLDAVGQRVVVVGGGLVGCEVGLHLAKNGKSVTVIEMQEKLAPDAYKMHRVGLIHELDQQVAYHTGMKCTRITATGVEAVDSTGAPVLLEADTVVYALGMQPNKQEALELQTAVKDVPTWLVGDCVAPGKVYDAVHQGFVAAMSIL